MAPSPQQNNTDPRQFTNEDLEEILEFATRAAKRSGEILLEHFGALKESQVSHKSVARDLVTAADVASERALVGALRERYPAHAIEAEEEVRDQASEAPRWFLDPLDGTVNFVHGLPLFAVSMGLFAGAEPAVAVIHVPRLGETFTAVRGGGAHLNGEPIAVSQAAELGEAVLATGFPYLRGQLENDNVENFNRFVRDVRGLRRGGSAAVDLAYTAAGRLDGYWELHLSPHDLAAGALLVREAGGLITDCAGGEAWLRGGHIVAAGRALHGRILERVTH